MRVLCQTLGTRRLLTIVGPGGIGKTRISVETLSRVGDTFPDGIWFVELAPIGSDDLVAVAICDAVDAVKTTAATPLERACWKLAAGRQLLVLDNCEHLTAAAARMTSALLRECPGLTVLATSREPLGLEDESVWPCPPLDMPAEGVRQPDELARSAAVQMFCDRAQVQLPSFRLTVSNAAQVGAICRRVDGLPLALELIAPWMTLLSPQDVLSKLDTALEVLARGGAELPSRQRTMRDVLYWSERLLTQEQRAAFCRLSVFAGGFSLAGAEAVLADLALAGVLDVIASLSARSLITADVSGDAARFRMLEPVRQYAAERLREDPRADHQARESQLAWLAELATEANEHILGGPDMPWLRRMDSELNNVRAALDWGFVGAPDLAASAATAMVYYCVVRGLLGEGRGWARSSLRVGGPALARAAFMTGLLSMWLGDVTSAEKALAQARSLLDDETMSSDRAMLAFAEAAVDSLKDDHASMEAHGREALEAARDTDDDARAMYALEALATRAYLSGDNGRSIELYRERLALAWRLGNEWTVAQSYNGIADAAIAGDNIMVAAEAIRDGLRAAEAVHAGSEDSSFVAYLVEDAGIVAIRTGHASAGLRLMSAAAASFDRARWVGGSPDDNARRPYWINTARSVLDAEESRRSWESGRDLAVAAAVTEALELLAAIIAVGDGTSAHYRHELEAREAVNAFVREGEFWSVTFAGKTIRLRDSKGLRDIARLLANPGREMAAVDLAASVESSALAVAGQMLPDSGFGPASDAGEVLDAEARRQYRERLVELEDEVNEATSANDPERATLARQEREFLLAELGAAVGLSGRQRSALDPAERARKAVSMRIRDAVGRMRAENHDLGDHMRRSIQTGAFCVYDPASPTRWRL